MGRNREVPEINSGSMADIAFLLLIFFLVATTVQNDKGLIRKLPQKQNETLIDINERNVFRVVLNKENQLMVEGELLQIENLEEEVVNFLDNGGETGKCDYCMGSKSKDLSDSPSDAVISFKSDRKALYGKYVEVQDKFTKAYRILRSRESSRLYGMDFKSLEEEYAKPETTQEMREILKERIKTIREMYPMQISESELIFKS
ncbi:ExbD/TolR family protein [Flagellimonas meridianipacifica]|uniref:Biopolymer transport protein ExbD n=1 Tax=Flagellimonas meridianipacifica TaxID=1080225 RepID=A0A2T0MJ95_9FLAO|nr:biopolymer transporter ExbD [Allomuricauda pacifica]PRX57652.1 biopolymer transport protein ExbD [Allomuricauda pacifica]